MAQRPAPSSHTHTIHHRSPSLQVAFLQGCTGLFGPTFMDDAVMEFLSATMEHYYDTTEGGGTSGGARGSAAHTAAIRSKL
jgi:hypothetical protein